MALLRAFFPEMVCMCSLLFPRLQVFTSTSTMVFKTFVCDHEVSAGDSYLRADYSLSCGTHLHVFFEAYATLMILVSKPACLLNGRRRLLIVSKNKS